MKLNVVKYGNKGSIELSTLLALMIALMMLPIALSIFKFSANYEYDYQEIEDEIVLYKLRKVYLLSYDQEIKSEEISFVYDNKTWNLSYINGHLLLKPGSLIYLDNIEYAEFYEYGDLLYVHYKRGDKEYEKVIGKKERLYRDDFLIDDDLIDESINGISEES